MIAVKRQLPNLEEIMVASSPDMTKRMGHCKGAPEEDTRLLAHGVINTLRFGYWPRDNTDAYRKMVDDILDHIPPYDYLRALSDNLRPLRGDKECRKYSREWSAGLNASDI
jgi:hypothetical protein